MPLKVFVYLICNIVLVSTQLVGGKGGVRSQKYAGRFQKSLVDVGEPVSRPKWPPPLPTRITENMR